jgi:hypothetical protein
MAGNRIANYTKAVTLPAMNTVAALLIGSANGSKLIIFNKAIDA